MKPLHEAVHDYLALRRSLGFKLRAAEDALGEFVAFIEQRGITRITTAIAVEWALSRSSTRPGSAADRLRHVRGFARHHLASEPSTEIPPVDLLPSHLRRRQPYLYSDDEVTRLLACALKLPPSDGLRPWTYHSFLGLLSATSLRLGEAIRLEVGDVDLEQGVLTIRQTKFGKSRLVSVDASTGAALASYQSHRDRFLRGRPQRRFFVSGKGTPLDPGSIHRTFYALLDQAAVHAPAAAPRPRLHDLRHRFALQALLRWYRAGDEVERRLPVLSTYLGHVSIENTYWYLSACPELMGHALARLEQRWEGRPAMTTATANLATLLEGYFTRRLMQQRQASPHTIASYRDTFRLLLRFAHKRLGTRPSAIAFEQIDSTLVGAFLHDLEDKRGISARSRNLRLSAIRSFFQYAAFEAPQHAAQIQRVLAIPGKRCTRTQVCWRKPSATTSARACSANPTSPLAALSYLLLVGCKVDRNEAPARDALTLPRGKVVA